MSEANDTTLKIVTEYRAEEVLDVMAELNLAAPANKRVQRFRRWYSILLIVLGLVFILFEEFASWNDLLFLAGIVIAAIGLVMIPLSSKGRLKKKLKRQIMEATDYSECSGMREYEFSDGGVSCASPNGTLHYTWNAIRAWGVCKNHLYLASDDGHALLVDTSQISPEERSALEGMLRERVPRASA